MEDILSSKIQCGKLFKINYNSKKMPQFLKNKKLSIGFDPKFIRKKLYLYFLVASKCKLMTLRENLIDKIWVKKKK